MTALTLLSMFVGVGWQRWSEKRTLLAQRWEQPSPGRQPYQQPLASPRHSAGDSGVQLAPVHGALGARLKN